MKQERFLGWNLFPELVTDTKNNHKQRTYEKIVLKQVVKCSIVVIILKNLYERMLRSFMNKTDNLRTTAY
jgi:hypothetical protein